MLITQQRLQERLTYIPETGIFTWRVTVSRTASVGSVAGRITGDGYRQIGVDGKVYLAHRLAFLYMTGKIPAFVDHRDGDRGNNKWVNLRGCTKHQNSMNAKRPKSSTSGVKGVCWSKSEGKWRVRASCNGKRISLGLYSDINEAGKVYESFAKEAHGEFYKGKVGEIPGEVNC